MCVRAHLHDNVLVVDVKKKTFIMGACKEKKVVLDCCTI